MVWTLTREKKDDWGGIIAYQDSNTGISPEMDARGDVATGLTAKEARELEVEAGIPTGSLSPNSEWWSEKFLIPFRGILKLDDSIPSDKIKLAVLRSMKKVAVGRGQLKTKSKAIFLLTSPELDVKVETSSFNIREEAWKAYFDLTPTKLRQVAVVLEKQKPKGKTTSVDSVTDESVKNTVRKELEKDPEFFLSIATDEDLGIKFEVIDLVAKRVLSVTSAGYQQKNDFLAPDLDGMVVFMKNPANSVRVLALKKELENKKK